MSDLISRSELLEEIEKYKFGAISNDAEREYVKETILNFMNFSQQHMTLARSLRSWKKQCKTLVLLKFFRTLILIAPFKVDWIIS